MGFAAVVMASAPLPPHDDFAFIFMAVAAQFIIGNKFSPRLEDRDLRALALDIPAEEREAAGLTG
jgi:hypothetical protein